MRSLTLATDRRQYNADSVINVRYDWEEPSPGGKALLSLEQLTAEGLSSKLVFVKEPQSEPVERTLEQEVLPGRLSTVNLRRLEAASNIHTRLSWLPGDQLILTITLHQEPDNPFLSSSTTTKIVLSVPIVDERLVSAPEAAYALLRFQEIEGRREVECVRFAWGPSASRIELVCADDLRGEVVRRRAVFQWQDSVRPGTLKGYALQKLSPAGSTHFPTAEP